MHAAPKLAYSTRMQSTAEPIGAFPNGEYATGFDFKAEIGVSGLKRDQAYIYEEWLPELRGDRGLRIMRQMIDGDPIIGAWQLILETLVRQVTYSVPPTSQSNEDLQAAEFVEQCLFQDMSMTFQDTLSEILTFAPWGFQWSEVVYKQRRGQEPGSLIDPVTQKEVALPESQFDDGKIGIRKLAPRAQESKIAWDFDDAGGVQAFVQQAPPSFVTVHIPIEKSLLFRTTSRKNNPEGRAMVRACYDPWFKKHHVDKIESIGIERDLAGMPVIWVPPQLLSENANANQKAMYAAFKKGITNIRRDDQDGLIMPLAYDARGNPLFKVELLSAAGSRQIDPDKIIQRCDQRIAMALMAEFILLGSDKVGSFALASSKTNLFAIALGTLIDAICDVINRHLIPKLLKYNGIKVKVLPKLIHGDIESIPLDEVAAWFTALAQAGFPLFPSPDGELEKWAIERVGGPVPEEGYEPPDPEAEFQQSLDQQKQRMEMMQQVGAANPNNSPDAQPGQPAQKQPAFAGAK